MSAPPPGRLAIVIETELIDPGVTRQYRHRAMCRTARMTAAIDRM